MPVALVSALLSTRALLVDSPVVKDCFVTFIFSIVSTVIDEEEQALWQALLSVTNGSISGFLTLPRNAGHLTNLF